jgi:Tfp pilus assembly protein PilE
MADKAAGKTLVIVAVALVVAAVLAYWGYGAYQKRELHSVLRSNLAAAGAQLREALALEAGPAPAEHLKAAQKIDAFAASAEQAVERMKSLPLSRDYTLADTVDGHLVTVREIFRKGGSIHRLHALRTESLGALQDHMRSDNRSGTWVKQAVSAKERAEKDFRDYRIAMDAYSQLLDALPASQKRIAAFAGTDALVDNALIAKARSHAIATAEQAAAEMEKVRRLAGPK